MSAEGIRTVTHLRPDGTIVNAKEPVAKPKSTEVLLKVSASLISAGTEGNAIRNRRSDPQPEGTPQLLGYQCGGEVLAVGENVTTVSPGQRVGAMGSGAIHGTHAIVPANLCFPLPDSVSFEEAAFANLAGTALQGIRRARLELGEQIAVLGLGIVGQITAQLGQLSGCHVLGCDTRPERLKLAEAVGITHVTGAVGDRFVSTAGEFARGYGLDAAMICFGGDASSAFDSIMQAMKVSEDGHIMGRIVLIGGVHLSCTFTAAAGNIDIRRSSRTGPGYHDPEYEHGKNYPAGFVPWTTRRNLEEIFRFIASGKLQLKPLITHRYPLIDAAAAYDCALDPDANALGVILVP